MWFFVNFKYFLSMANHDKVICVCPGAKAFVFEEVFSIVCLFASTTKFVCLNETKAW